MNDSILGVTSYWVLGGEHVNKSRKNFQNFEQGGVELATGNLNSQGTHEGWLKIRLVAMFSID